MEQADDVWSMRAILKDLLEEGIGPAKSTSTSAVGEGHATETWYEPPEEVVIVVAGSDLAEFTIPPKYVPSIKVERECNSVAVMRATFDATLTRFDDRFRRATYLCETA